MQIEVGEILEGKVTGITNFGAFIELSDDKTGMVHISEIAATFVKEIRDFVTEDQVVKVKVLSIEDDGKIGLSMKQAQPANGKTSRPKRQPRQRNRRQKQPAVSPGRPGSFEWQSSRNDSSSFEDMMSNFKKASDEKMSDLKRSMDGKNGGFSYRGGSR